MMNKDSRTGGMRRRQVGEMIFIALSFMAYGVPPLDGVVPSLYTFTARGMEKWITLPTLCHTSEAHQNNAIPKLFDQIQIAIHLVSVDGMGRKQPWQQT
jgi:hypothetical protein